MTSEEYGRASEVFDKIGELPEVEREAAINAACARGLPENR
jgi:hypothetical protein